MPNHYLALLMNNSSFVIYLHYCFKMHDRSVNEFLVTYVDFFLQDIKATHLAIEAPFQVLLKLSMISIGILELPGTWFSQWNMLSVVNNLLFTRMVFCYGFLYHSKTSILFWSIFYFSKPLAIVNTVSLLLLYNFYL